MNDLIEAFKNLDEDPTVGAMVLTGKYLSTVSATLYVTSDFFTPFFITGTGLSEGLKISASLTRSEKFKLWNSKLTNIE